MTEKRKFERYECSVKTKFEYFEGNPDTIDIEITVPEKGKGHILDISKGGVFIVTNEKVNVGIPIRIEFSTKKKKYKEEGIIIRTGLLENNPTEVAVRLSKHAKKGDSYIACEFNTTIEDFNEDELK